MVSSKFCIFGIDSVEINRKKVEKGGERWRKVEKGRERYWRSWIPYEIFSVPYLY